VSDRIWLVTFIDYGLGYFCCNRHKKNYTGTR